MTDAMLISTTFCTAAASQSHISAHLFILPTSTAALQTPYLHGNDPTQRWETNRKYLR